MSANNIVSCPTRAELLAFSQDDLADDLQRVIEIHLDGCLSCLATLQALDDGADPLLMALRKTVPSGLFDEDGDPSLHQEEADEGLPQVPGYEVLRNLGRGGMGVVYGVRDPDLHRTLAIKVLRQKHRGRPDLEQRFLEEAQLMGQLQHPGITPVHEVGRLSDGRPFFAMKLVQGRTLEEFAEERSDPAADLPRFLRIFVQVCQTVAYAHSRGVLHRDLKPSNVMVGTFGEVQVMDWGLAKVQGPPTNGELPSADDGTSTIVTVRTLTPGLSSQTGTVLGTPAYMSPEQAAGRLDELGPASDIYSLGATLYTLLTGQAPFCRQQGLAETLRRVQSGEFPKPREVKKDLPAAPERICLKAMALQPVDRYGTALELAADIEHWLADEPVGAWREPWMVRAGRWVQRHRTLVTSSLAVLLVAVALLTGATVLLDVAWNQEHQARLDTEKARNREAAVANFLVEAFRSPNPFEGTKDLSIGDRLDLAAARLDTEFADDPVTKAQILNALGATYLGLGMTEKAIQVLENARALTQSVLGLDHPDTLTSMNNLAGAYRKAGRLDDALPLFEETLKLRKAKFGPDHPDTLTALNNLALAYHAAGRLADALLLFEKAWTVSRATLGPDHADTLVSMNNLAGVYRDADRLADALPLFEETLKLRKAKFGPDHPHALTSLSNLATAYHAAGRLADALPLLEETLKLVRAKLDPEHPHTLTAMNNLALAYKDAGRLADALPLYEETLKLRRAKLGPDHPDLLASMNNLAAAYREVGRLADALPLCADALKLLRAKHGPDHPYTFAAMNSLAVAYREVGRLTDALPLLEETLKLLRAKFDPDHPHTLTAMNNLAVAYKDAGRLTDALPIYEETLKLRRAKFGPDHFYTLGSMNNLATAYWTAGKLVPAEELLREALDHGRRKLLADSPLQLSILSNLAGCLLRQDRFSEAEPFLQEYLVSRKKMQPDHWSHFHAQSLVGECLAGQKQYAEAEPLLLSGYEGMQAREKQIPAPDRRNLVLAAEQLVKLYEAWGEPKKAAEWRSKLPKASKPMKPPEPGIGAPP